MIVVNDESCVGCCQCVPFCLTDAIHVWVVAEINIDDCTECLQCIDYCPVEALEVR